MIEITRPGPHDLDAIVSLKREVHALHVANAGWFFLDAGEGALAQTIRSRLADRSSRVLVARRDGEVVGYVSASVRVRPATPISRDDRAIYLDEICVLRDCRRAGTGRLLVEALLAGAREEGIDRVELDAWAFNVAAARFFEKLGFRPHMHRFSIHTPLQPASGGRAQDGGRTAPSGAGMNDALLDPIRHNSWATRRLVAFCRDLSLTDEQLATSRVGAFGGILATLDHVIRSDASYVRALLGERGEREGGTDLEGLAARAEENEKLWERLLSGPVDVERVIVVDEGASEVRAGVFLAQALNHANHHRAQVSSILAGLGIKAPDLQAWEYAWATRRLWARTGGGPKP